jgi:hypothetical protein
MSRLDKNCPSAANLDPPDVSSAKRNQERILHNASFHKPFDTCELINDVRDSDIQKRINKKVSFEAHNGEKRLKAEKLDMDHVYISYTQLLWAMIFVGPMSFFLWKKNIAWLRIRTFLSSKGLIKVKDFDIEALIGKLVLEQSQAIHYFAKTKQNSKMGNIAGFFFADFPYIDSGGEYKVADLLAVDIDLDTNRFVKCKIDDENLTASETLIFLWFNTIAAQHVKLHSLANWGVNCDEKVKEINPYLYTNSLVTVVYNYFGFTTFTSFMDEWKRQGVLAKDWIPESLTKCFSHGYTAGIAQHAQIVELMPHSEFVNFVVKVRLIFHSEFKKYQHLFPDINAEALFAGTVLHSLDHALMDWNLEDPLWLDVDHPKYGKMAQVGRVVKVGFVPRVKGYYFHHTFKGSNHPFYESIYKKAAKINQKFADNMQTCICR